MADLPRYNETGRVYSDLPSLDFANVKENFKFSQALTNNLDRLSDFATKMAEKETERKAEQFAIDNPITLDDIKNAEKTGASALDLVKATGGGSIWQETVRKFQASQLRTQLEVEAQSAALQINNQIKMQQITDPMEIKAKYNALVNGLGKPLSTLDGEEYLKYKASTGTLVKGLEKIALDKVYDDYVLDKKVQGGVFAREAIEAVDVLYKTQKDPELVKASLNARRQTLVNLVREAGPEFAMETLKQFDKDVEEKKINHFIDIATKDEFAKNPITGKRDENIAMSRMITGDFGDDSALFKTLEPKEQALVRSSYRTRENDRIATEKQVQEEQTIKDVQDVNNLEMDFFNSGKKDRSALRKLEEIVRRNPKALTAEGLERIKKGDPDDDEKAQFSNAAITLKERIRANPNMSWTDVKIQGKQLGISEVVINRYIYPVFTSNEERDYNRKLLLGSANPISNISGFVQKTTQMDDNQAVTDYRNQIIEKNKKLKPGEKPEPVPSKSEALDIIRDKQAKSPATQDIKTVISETNLYLKTRKIGNITIDENSSFSDTVLSSQINRKDSKGKYILPDDVRQYLETQLKAIDAARARR